MRWYYGPSYEPHMLCACGILVER